MNTHTDDAPVPLYHGTSTLFLDEILQHGLGGLDPIKKWKVLEFAQTIRPLVLQHIATEEAWIPKVQSFGFMCEQLNAGMNYQHGCTYLTPSRIQAIGYTISKRWGSELLSYALDFLDELVRRQVPGVCDTIYQQYPQIFRLLTIPAAPLVIEVQRLHAEDLLLERGDPVGPYYESLRELHRSGGFSPHHIPGPCFRLNRPVPVKDLQIWLVNVHVFDKYEPEYSLHELPNQVPSRFRGVKAISSLAE